MARDQVSPQLLMKYACQLPDSNMQRKFYLDQADLKLEVVGTSQEEIKAIKDQCALVRPH